MGNTGKKEKLFVNLVESPMVAAPTSREGPKGRRGAGGQAWSLPHVVGPMRMEKDKAGNHASTCDVCFHPEAFQQASRLAPFKDLVVSSALEGVENSAATNTRGGGERMVIERKYHIVVGVKYKSGKCAV
ncbi:unnamed protein product, partial [Discosporangium mesarthrocarpum]